MIRVYFILFFLTVTAVLFLNPPKIQAEIATTHDWIGLFSTTAGNLKTNTVNGNSWVYANSCTQTAGNTPKLTNTLTDKGCSFENISPAPITGYYEYRLYANDYSSADGIGLIAVSKALSADSPSPSPGIVSAPCPMQIMYPRVQNGLISTPTGSNNFGNPTATCVISSQASFVPFKIPSYADLKSLYYTQSKALKSTRTDSDLTTVLTDGIYNYTNSPGVSINTIYSYTTGTVVVFIDGRLTINNNIIGNSGTSGIVFVTKGDVNINASVARIDAVIISSGKIYTAGATCNPSSVSTTSPLIVNGSLVNLDSEKPINFCRKLANNDAAAEQIIQQPKYLVILRNMYSDSWQKWSEIQ